MRGPFLFQPPPRRAQAAGYPGSALARATAGAAAAATGAATARRTAGTSATGASTRAVAGRAVAGRAVACVATRAAVVAGAGGGMVGREVHGIAGMAIRTGRLAGARSGTGASAGTAGTSAAARAAAARLATRTRLAARAGVAVAAGAGTHAIGHVPDAERGRIAVRQLVVVLLLALLERLLRLLGRHLATDGQAAVRLLATAATAAVLAHVVEAAQLAALVGGVVAVDVGLAALANAHRGLGRAALADHRLQGQGGGGGVLELELGAQRVDLLDRQLLRLSAQQLARQADLAVAHALEAADLAALRLPQAAHLAVAAFLDHDLEPVVRVSAADALDLVELGRAVLKRHAAGEAVDNVVRHGLLAFRGAHAHHVLALD